MQKSLKLVVLKLPETQKMYLTSSFLKFVLSTKQCLRVSACVCLFTGWGKNSQRFSTPVGHKHVDPGAKGDKD